MLSQNRKARSWAAIPTAISFILYPVVPLVSAQQPPSPTATQAESEAPAQGVWPRWFETSSGGTVVMYAPQVSSWDGQRLMVFRAAVSFTYKDSQKPDLGTVEVEADTKVNLARILSPVSR